MNDEWPDDASLRRALSAWRADVELPPDFRGAVWSRIRRREERRAGRWLWIGETVNWLLGDIRLAAAVPAMAVAIGFLLVWWHDRPNAPSPERRHQIAYVDSLDPYALAARRMERP
jgi:hypothetical protein